MVFSIRLWPITKCNVLLLPLSLFRRETREETIKNIEIHAKIINTTMRAMIAGDRTVENERRGSFMNSMVMESGKTSLLLFMTYLAMDGKQDRIRLWYSLAFFSSHSTRIEH